MLLTVICILFPFYLKLVKSIVVYQDVKFFDPYVINRWTLETETIASWNHLPIKSNPKSFLSFNNGEYLMLLSKESLFIGDLMNNQWKRIDGLLSIVINEMMSIEKINDKGVFVIGGGKEVWKIECDGMEKVKIVYSLKSEDFMGYVNEIKVHNEEKESIWIGSGNGLFFIDEKHEEVKKIENFDVKVNCISTYHYSDKKILVAIGTDDQLLYFYDENFDVSSWKYFWVTGTIDDAITSLDFDYEGSKLYIGNSLCLNILDLSTMVIDRIGGNEGLPYANITRIKSTKDRVFIGTKKGLCVFNVLDSSWSYYFMDRWIHGKVVQSIDTLLNGVFVLTELGASFIGYKYWTLEEKALNYEKIVIERHNRYGLVSDVGLKNYGDLNSFVKRDTDNDGLWTCMYLCGEVFRYAVTKTEEAKTSAWTAFQGLEFLNNSTGVRGFVARSVLPKDSSIPPGEWHNSTTMPDFVFKADTSSDEIIGHMSVYPLFYDLVAKTAEEKARPYKLADDMVRYIVKNNYYYMDVGGKTRTRWGVWNPKELNHEKEWIEQRGLNSLQMLGFLVNAYRITGDKLFLDSYHDLVNIHGYDQNIINQKLEVPYDINHSDDELGFMGYISLFYGLTFMKDKEFDLIKQNLVNSVERNYKFIEKEKSSLFNIIYLMILDEFSTTKKEKKETTDKNKVLLDAIWTLKTWPIDLIGWEVNNDHRIDRGINPDQSYWQNSIHERMNIIPYNENSFFRWNGNPYKHNGGNGFYESDPGAWTFSYWMARYYGYISAPKV